MMSLNRWQALRAEVVKQRPDLEAEFARTECWPSWEVAQWMEKHFPGGNWSFRDSQDFAAKLEQRAVEAEAKKKPFATALSELIAQYPEMPALQVAATLTELSAAITDVAIGAAIGAPDERA